MFASVYRRLRKRQAAGGKLVKGRPRGRGLAAMTPSTRARRGRGGAAGRTGPPPPAAGARARAKGCRARGAASRGPAAPRARVYELTPPAASSRPARLPPRALRGPRPHTSRGSPSPPRLAVRGSRRRENQAPSPRAYLKSRTQALRLTSLSNRPPAPPPPRGTTGA